jgi:tetratricopeptide (TPR) repeat protein
MVAASSLLLFLFAFAAVLGFASLLLTATVVVLGIGAALGALRVLRTLRPWAALRQRPLAGGKAVTALAARTRRVPRAVFSRVESIVRSWRRNRPAARVPHLPMGARRLRPGSQRVPARSAPERRRKAYSLNAQGVRCRRVGRHTSAVEMHLAALQTLRELGDRQGEALTLNNLALAVAHDDDEAALDHFEQAVAILRELSDEQHEGQVIANLGFVHRRRGRDRQAADCLRTALEKLHPESHEYRRVAEQLRRAS